MLLDDGSQMMYRVKFLSSGRAAILGYTMPIFTALIGFAFFGERASLRLWLGVVAALAGAALLLWREIGAITGSPAGRMFIPVIGVFSGMVILGERPAWQDYAALVSILMASTSGATTCCRGVGSRFCQGARQRAAAPWSQHGRCAGCWCVRRRTSQSPMA